MGIQKINIRTITISLLWILAGIGAVVLSVAAMKRQAEKLCSGIEINISGVSNNFFIDKADVLKIINAAAGENLQGRRVSEFNLQSVESMLEKDVWVDNAELYFDNSGLLQVSIEEREPIARVFTRGGNTFYIDTTATILPLSDKFSARLPVFTGFTSETKFISQADSGLLVDIKKISMALQADSFLMAMIDQVDITQQRTFEMVPKIGNQVILLGDATDMAVKLSKLKLFYKMVITKSGWNHYGCIDLQYKDQVVAKLSGKQDIAQDSLRTLQLMEYMAKNAAIQSADSLRVPGQPGNDNVNVDATIIQQSIERDDNPESSAAGPDLAPVAMQKNNMPVIEKPVTGPVAKPTVANPAVLKAAIKKPSATSIKNVKPAQASQKPKIVMPKKNDY